MPPKQRWQRSIRINKPIALIWSWPDGYMLLNVTPYPVTVTVCVHLKQNTPFRMMQALSAASCYLLYPFLLSEYFLSTCALSPQNHFETSTRFLRWTSPYLPLALLFTAQEQTNPFHTSCCICLVSRQRLTVLAQVGLELTIFPPQAPECWDCKCAPTGPGYFSTFEGSFSLSSILPVFF